MMIAKDRNAHLQSEMIIIDGFQDSVKIELFLYIIFSSIIIINAVCPLIAKRQGVSRRWLQRHDL